MIDCSQFLAFHTDYRDQLLDPVSRADVTRHLEQCGACARYDRVVGAGIDALLAVPEILPSDDFMARLDGRLALVDELTASRSPSGAPIGLVFALGVAIAAAAWAPALRTDAEPVRLPPAVAHAPYHPRILPLVFHPGLLPAPAAAPEYARTSARRSGSEPSPYSLLGVPDPTARRAAALMPVAR